PREQEQRERAHRLGEPGVKGQPFNGEVQTLLKADRRDALSKRAAGALRRTEPVSSARGSTSSPVTEQRGEISIMPIGVCVRVY
ncbi:hypothetical protein QQF64_031331, partial [Cirrhinus molitorella]